MNTTEKYLHDFVSLKTAIIDGKKAPHKAILLLAIMELIADGIIEENHIVLSNELVTRFGQVWDRYINTEERFKKKIVTPFWHLKNEPFYHIFLNDGTPATTIENPYSVKKLKELVYVSLDNDLFKLIKTESGKEELSTVLTINYLEIEEVSYLI